MNNPMATTNNPLNAYRETQIKTAGQGRLIVMLYDAAIRQIDLAAAGLDGSEGSSDTVNRAIVKAQDVVTELMVSLDFEKGGEIARGLFNLYLYFNRQMIEANLRKDSGPLREVRRMLDELREAWLQILGTPPPNSGGQNGLNIAG